MPQRCIVSDCPSVASADTQPEAGWLMVKLVGVNVPHGLMTAAFGLMCPSCSAKLPKMRSTLEQIVQPEPPDLEPAAAAPNPAPSAPAPDSLADAAAAPETMTIEAADVGPVPDELK